MSIAKRGVFYCTNTRDIIPTTKGVYCIMPSWANSMVKIGMATNLRHRMDSYCSCFPNGFRVLAIHTIRGTASATKAETKIFKIMATRGHPRLPPVCSTRTKPSEWIRVKNMRMFVVTWRHAVGEAIGHNGNHMEYFDKYGEHTCRED